MAPETQARARRVLHPGRGGSPMFVITCVTGRTGAIAARLLLEAGRKVAICDQTETPKAGKLVARALTRRLRSGRTPGLR